MSWEWKVSFQTKLSKHHFLKWLQQIRNGYDWRGKKTTKFGNFHFQIGEKGTWRRFQAKSLTGKEKPRIFSSRINDSEEKVRQWETLTWNWLEVSQDAIERDGKFQSWVLN